MPKVLVNVYRPQESDLRLRPVPTTTDTLHHLCVENTYEAAALLQQFYKYWRQKQHLVLTCSKRNHQFSQVTYTSGEVWCVLIREHIADQMNNVTRSRWEHIKR